jgi:hypothetical protein
MKTTFKVRRGHVWHVIHETKTAKAPGTVWTLCGQYYEEGERGTRSPTCPGCLKFDNPLTLSDHVRQGFQIIVGSMPPYGVSQRVRETLVQADLITHEDVLTRRGRILAEDFQTPPVPLGCFDGLVHARKPLGMYPRCQKNGRLMDVNEMTVERYGKLRLVADQVMITCLQCIALEDRHDDLY